MAGRSETFDRNFLPRAKMHRSFARRFPVHEHVPRFDQLLHPRPAELRALCCDKAVQPRPGISGRDDEFAMRSGIVQRHGKIVARGEGSALDDKNRNS